MNHRRARTPTPLVYGIYLADLNRASNQSHGIINYSIGLAVSLSKVLGPSEELVVYANDEITEELGGIDPSNTRIHRMQQPSNYARRLFLDSRVAWTARRHGVKVLHFPKGLLPLCAPPSGPRLLTTIHDDIPMQYSHGGITRGTLRSRIRARLIASLFMRSLRKSDFVITISERSHQSLTGRLLGTRAGARGTGPDIRVITLGSTLPALPYVPRAERLPVVLHFASALAHKRTTFTVESMTRYLDERGDGLRLQLVGRLPPDLNIEDPRIEYHEETISNDDIAALMSRSRALLFPSLTEGFGLPPIEAWHYGTPSMYYSAPALEEMPRPIPGHLTDTSYEAFATALDTILALDDADLVDVRDAIVARSSWETLARRVLDVYREQAALTTRE